MSDQTFDPPILYVPEWTFTQKLDGFRSAQRVRDGLTVEPHSSFASAADVPVDVLLWVLNADTRY